MNVRARRVLVALVLAALGPLGGPGADAGAAARPPRSASGLELRQIGRFEQPTYVTQAPGEPHTVYVVEQPGLVVAVRKGRALSRPFLDITERVHFGSRETPSVEAGLYSIAFDPAYQRNRSFYVFYTGPGGNNYIDRYRRAGGRAVAADPRSRRSLLEIKHPYADSHNGGQLQIGPDGMLWATTGDGGCCDDAYDQARSLGTLLGKLLRIDPTPPPGSRLAPPGNPLVGVPGLDAIYAWGLRNTWRFSFDRLTGALALADVGDNAMAREEVDFLTPGAADGARTSAGPSTRAFTSTTRADPASAGRYGRCSATSTPEGDAARSRAATSFATRPCRSSTGAICGPTTAEAASTASRRRPPR